MFYHKKESKKMSHSFNTDEAGKTFIHVHLSSKAASTFHSDRITLDKTTAIIAEVDALSELEWYKIISNPHVRNNLRNLAIEARRQIAAGETEEGGFGIE